MKIHIPIPLNRLLLGALLSASTFATAHAAEGSTASVKLSAPDKPATFTLDMPWAEIRITGTDGDTITVDSSLAERNTKPAKPGGLRRLDNEVSFELTEKDNVVTLSLTGDNPWGAHDAEFKISVPRSIALNLKTGMGGDLVVKGVEGDVEIENMNGEVSLDGLKGSAVISTMNGEVRAVYAAAPQKPVSITSMNGEIDLRVPADTKANVRMNTHNGSILTDFSEDVLKTKTEGSTKTGHTYSYSYGHEESARAAAHAAADAARVAVQVSRDVAREVSREVARAVKEGTGETSARAPRAPRAPRPPMPPVTGGKLVSGTLNGGGVDIKVSTMNGEITLRQTK
jgi:hypothetical protein